MHKDNLKTMFTSENAWNQVVHAMCSEMSKHKVYIFHRQLCSWQKMWQITISNVTRLNFSNIKLARTNLREGGERHLAASRV